MIETARRLRRLFGLGRARWLVLFVLVIATSAMEALAAALVFAVVNLLSAGSTHIPVVGQVTVEHRGLALFTLCVTGFFLLRAGLVVLHDSVLYRLCYGAGADLEEALLRGYLTLSPRQIRSRGHADLVRNVHDTVISVVEGCLLPSILAIGKFLSAIGIVGVMVAVAPLPTLVAGAVFAPLLWLISRGVRTPVRRLGEEVEESLASSLRAATETLNLAGDIRMAGRTEDFGARFGQVRRRLARAGGAEEVIRAVPRLAVETVLVLFVIAYLALATADGTPTAALPTLGLFGYAALRVMPSLIGLVGLVHSIAHSSPAVETILADEALLHPPLAALPAGPPPSTMALRGVTVRLPESGRCVLRDVDLTLQRGDVVAVVGPNGAGKSTLLDVLAGALLPASGVVTVDGRPLADRGAAWSGGVAMVPQHVHLLDADIATNVTLDPSGDSAQDPRLAEVLRDVGLQPVIDRLGGRSVGEDGRTLSGGERQRVAVARALYRSAGVLLIDEGTSALDSSARDALRELVDVGRDQRITVLVTHDPELVHACTRVVRVENGRLSTVERLVG